MYVHGYGVDSMSVETERQMFIASRISDGFEFGNGPIGCNGVSAEVLTEDQAQIFGVDVWRMKDIADKLHSGQPDRQHKALLSELVYTLGEAAVLTKGDVPVYMIQAALGAPDGQITLQKPQDTLLLSH